MRDKNLGRFISVFILLLCFGFVFVVTRFVPPLGDDVLFQFDNAYEYYHVSDEEASLYIANEQIDDFATLLRSLHNLYLNWTGRMTGWLIVPVLSFTGEVFTSILQATFFTAYVALISALVFRGFKNALSHPIALPLIFLLVIFYSTSIGVLLIITFTAIYIVTTVLYLLYINVNNNLLKNNYKTSIGKLVAFNVLGFVTGFTHEMLGAMFILIIGLRLLFLLFIEKKIKFIDALKHNVGLAIGYILCFIAPGNFVRAGTDHDTGILKPYSEKLALSIRAHIDVFKTYSNVGLLLALGLLLLTFISLIILIKNKKLKEWIRDNFEYIAVSALSPFIWALVSYVPNYGLNYWCALVFIVEAGCIYKAINLLNLQRYNVVKRLYTVAGGVSALALIGLFFIHSSWISDLIPITLQRELLIEQAVENEDKAVKVPLYPITTENIYTLHNYNNLPDEFKSDYYIKYYGIEIIPTE